MILLETGVLGTALRNRHEIEANGAKTGEKKETSIGKRAQRSGVAERLK